MKYIKDSNFIILCPSRSGSTMLVHLLRSHPEVWCNGEVFLNNYKIGALEGIYRKKISANNSLTEILENELKHDIIKFTYKYALDPQGRRVSGFKFKLDEYYLNEFRDIKNIILQDTDFKIIFLTRKNLFDRYISWYVANYISKTTLVIAQDNMPQLKKVTIDPQKCLANFHKISVLQKAIRAELHNHRVLDIFYEDLIAAPNETQEKICNFLEVKVRKLCTPTKKIITQTMDELISNYNELKNFFQYTDFKHLLKS